MRKFGTALLMITALGCGDTSSPEKSIPVVIVMDNNETMMTENNAVDGPDVSAECCGGRECGAAPGCEASCGTCGEGAFCDDGGSCIAAAPDAPRIIDFATNVTTMTPNDRAVFSAVVTDPDGIDDLIGGTLKAPSGASYGAFQTASAEGAYQLELDWSALNSVQAIVFDDSVQRTFVAEFFDQAGNKVQSEVTLTLKCAGATESACAAGVCVDTASTKEHCGACGNDITDAENANCVDGRPACHDSFADYCAAQNICWGDYQPDACGSCDNDCGRLAPMVGVTLDGESNTVWCDEGFCEISFSTTSRTACREQCGPLECITGSASYEFGGVSAGCDHEWEPTYDDYGSFEATHCNCAG